MKSVIIMPMLKKYSQIFLYKEPKISINNDIIITILNYSKSIEVKESKTINKKIVIKLN